MSHYKIIADEQELRAFIDWLPDLKESECFYVGLFARKKYYQGDDWPGGNKNNLKRFTSSKEYLFDKIRQLEAPMGCYQIGHGEAPPESIAVYITVNPRCFWRATLNGISSLATLVKNDCRTKNPHQEILKTIHNSPSYKKYVSFDIDSKNEDNLNKILDISGAAATVVETRGGYHILVEPVKMPKNTNWHKEISQFADVTGDALLPIPGCWQGGFMPRMIKK